MSAQKPATEAEVVRTICLGTNPPLNISEASSILTAALALGCLLPEDAEKLRADRDQAREWQVRHIQAANVAEVECAALRATLKRTLSSLVAATSILQRAHQDNCSPRVAVASDRMFEIMMADYEKAADAGRGALTPEPTP